MKQLFIILMISSLGTVACTPSFIKRSGGGSGSPRASEKNAAYTDDLVQQFNQFYNGKDYSLSPTCDTDLKDIKMEIVTELEKRRSEIQEQKYLPEENTTGKIYEMMTFGSIEFYNNEDDVIDYDKWEYQKTTSWTEILDLYSKIKDTPTDKKWVKLDDVVRVATLSDRNRIITWKNFSLTPKDRKNLKSFIKIAEGCLARSTCEQINIPNFLEKWINTKRYYPNHVKELSERTGQDFRVYLQFVVDALNIDYDGTFNGTHGHHQINKETSTITVHIDLSAFAPDERKLADYIERYWSRPGIQIKVLTQADPNYSFYKVIVAPMAARSYVQYSTRTMVVSPNVGIKTVMHEFGHVLGLNDEYYTLWDEKKCQYSYYFNSGNIMSDEETGAILPAHIQALKDLYFVSISSQ